MCFQTLYWMELCGQLHTLAASLPWIEKIVRPEQKTVWAFELVQPCWLYRKGNAAILINGAYFQNSINQTTNYCLI